MTKEQLMRRISHLPLFSTADVHISNAEDTLNAKDFKAIYEGEILCQPVAIVSRHYKLVQLRDALSKAVEKLPEEIEGQIYYFFGRALMSVYPVGSEVGLRVSNSVDAKWALRVDFAVRPEGIGGYSLVVPQKRLKGFRRIHKGKVLLEYEDFLKVIADVREVWRTIVEKMSAIPVDKDKLEEVKRVLRFGKRLGRDLDEIWHTYKGNYLIKPKEEQLTLWVLFRETIKKLSKRSYKSGIHKVRRLENVGKVMMNYAFFSEVI